MALKYVDNFSFWTTTPGTFQSVVASASVSGGLLSLSGTTGGALISNYLTAQDTYIINMRVNIGTAPSGVPSVGPSGTINLGCLNDGVESGNTRQSGLSITNTGKLQFYRNPASSNGTAIGAESINALSFDAGVTYYDIEFKIVVGDSGLIEARLNGGVQIGPSTVDTKHTSNSSASSLRLREDGGSSSAGGGGLSFEHYIVMDGSGSAANNFLGPVDVELLGPTGDGNYTTWTPNAGTRWEAVDDADPDGDTTYVTSAAVGDKITFTAGNLPANSTAVKCAAVWARARRDDATTRAFKVLLRNAGGTDNLGGTEHFLGDDYQWFFQPYEVSPFTSSAWTVSEINGIEFGAEITT